MLIKLMTFFWFLSSVAWAGPVEDLQIASNPNLSVDLRMSAFDRLVLLGATDVRVIREYCLGEDKELRSRWVAIRVMGKVGGAPAREVLPLLSVSEQPVIRAAAVSAIGDMGNTEYLDTVIVRLKDEAILVRAAAAESLGKLKDNRALEPLENVFNAPDSRYQGASLWIRRHYIMAMGEIGDASVYPTLLMALNDDDPTVVLATVEALEKISNFSFSDGRTPLEEQEAWRRWLNDKLK